MRCPQSLIEKTRQKRAGILEEIEWRGRKVHVRPERVRLFLLADKQLNGAIDKASTLSSKIELMENNLMDCKDAIASLRDEIKGDPVRLRCNYCVVYFRMSSHHF